MHAGHVWEEACSHRYTHSKSQANRIPHCLAAAAAAGAVAATIGNECFSRVLSVSRSLLMFQAIGYACLSVSRQHVCSSLPRRQTHTAIAERVFTPTTISLATSVIAAVIVGLSLCLPDREKEGERCGTICSRNHARRLLDGRRWTDGADPHEGKR